MTLQIGTSSQDRQLLAPHPSGPVQEHYKSFDPFSLSSKDALLSISLSPRHPTTRPTRFPVPNPSHDDAFSSCNSTVTELSKKFPSNLSQRGDEVGLPSYRLDGNRRTVGSDLAIFPKVSRFSARADHLPLRQVFITLCLTSAYIDYIRDIRITCQPLLRLFLDSLLLFFLGQVEMTGVEPVTSGLQSQRSPS